METQWQKEFGQEFTPPVEIQEAVKQGKLKDISWHNDTCPSFCAPWDDQGNTVVLWSDAAKVEDREQMLPKRFAVIFGDSMTPESSRTLLDTDNIKDALQMVYWFEQLAREFARLFREAVTPEQLQECIKLNRREGDAMICHSHDYLDANMTMDEAFTRVVGKECNPDDTVDALLWGTAWTLAKKNDFYAPPSKDDRVKLKLALLEHHPVFVGNDLGKPDYERVRAELIRRLGYDRFRDLQNEIFAEIVKRESDEARKIRDFPTDDQLNVMAIGYDQCQIDGGE